MKTKVLISSCIFLLLIGIFSTIKYVTTTKQTLVERQETILYIPLVSAPLDLIAVKATFAGGKSGDFILDSGGGRTLIVDSTFFYKNIDTTHLVQKPPHYSMYYWHTVYEGIINISIGYHNFNVSRIEVREWLNIPDGHNNIVGFIGEGAFLDKITIIDQQERKIAFVDSLTMDSSYYTIPFSASRVYKEETKNQKFVTISGFIDKKGNNKSGNFLFDTGAGITGFSLKESFAADIDISTKRVENLIKAQHIRWKEDLIIGDSLLAKNVPVRQVQKGSYDEFAALMGGDGLMGMPLLKRYNIIADYKNNMLYLKPNANFYQEQ